MKLNTENLEQLSKLATNAAKEAGQLISHYTKQQIEVKNKIAGESLASQVVTEVDLLAQDIILRHLNPTLKQFDLALLTEEIADDYSRREKDYFWCIDPLDGTLPFVESTPGYAVSIALVSHAGIPLIGVVYDPVKENLYQAIKGQSSQLNGQPWKPYPKDSKELFTFITDRSFLKDRRYQNFIQQLTTLIKAAGYQELQIIQHGGAVMNALWVLEQQPAIYCKLPKEELGGGSLWDFAATACIIEETDAVVYDINGKALDLNREDSTFMNHRGIIYASDKNWGERIKEMVKDKRG